MVGSRASSIKSKKEDSADPLEGRPGYLTEEQQNVLNELRKELKDEGLLTERDDDACLCRFLRARKFNLAKAKEMILAMKKWRKTYGVDYLYANFKYPERKEVSKYYPQYYHKTDRDGRPIYIEQLGNLNYEELRKVTSMERQLQSLVVEYEKMQRDRLPACSESQGRLVETSCTIMDLKNCGIAQFWPAKDYVKKASEIGQNYYPEVMGKFYIINAPFFFSTVWSLVKPWLDENTVRKIMILGHNYHDKLFEQIQKENLPHSLGGTCDCPEGCEFSDAGVWNEVEKKENGTAVGNGADAPAPIHSEKPITKAT